MRRSLVALAALAAALAQPAAAAVLAEDELAEESTEAGAVVRSLAFVLTGPVLQPPLAPPGTDPTGLGIFDLRAYAAHRTPSLALVAHAQLSSAVRSSALGGGLVIGRGVEPPRWLPLRWRVVDQDTLAVTATVDWLYAAYTRGPVTMTVGRQPVTFGRTRLWTPTDLVATFALTEVDTEYKPGADAVRIDAGVGARAQVTLVAATGALDDRAGASLQGTTALARGTWAWDGGEAGALAAFVRGDWVVGVDAALDMTAFELYGEATATVITDRSLAAPAAGDVAARAAVGATFRPRGDLTLATELLYSGFGATRPDDYLIVAASPRVAIGEQTTLGAYYAGAILSWQAHPLLQLGGAGLINLGDASGLLSLVLRASLSDNTQAVAGAYVGVGDAPELQGAALLARDEFGLYPRFLFAELKTVF